MARRHSIFSGSRFILKALVFTLVATAVWLLVNVGSLREFLDTYHRRKAEEDRIAILRTDIENLKGRQRSLELGGVETERQVRERFGMHKPGEQVIFLENSDEQATRSAAGAAPTTAAAATSAPAAATAATSQPASAARGSESPVSRRESRHSASANAARDASAGTSPGALTNTTPGTSTNSPRGPSPTAARGASADSGGSPLTGAGRNKSAGAATPPGDPPAALPARPRLDGNRALPGPARMP